MDDDELERRFDALMQRINDNHETLLLELSGIQTDVRSLKAGEAATRTYIDARASQTEMLITKLFDRLNERLDQTELSVEERLRKLEGNVEPLPARMSALEARFSALEARIGGIEESINGVGLLLKYQGELLEKMAGGTP